MRKQHRFNDFLNLWHSVEPANKISWLLNRISWLEENGFMQERATDPLSLGLNVCATGYHYLAVLVSGPAWRQSYGLHFLAELLPPLRKILAEKAAEDDCVCWCNSKDHGCSPNKLSLIEYLHATIKSSEYTKGVYQHAFLHQGIFGTGPECDRISPLIRETLRLLTFEALEMTHTCCSLDWFWRHDPSGLTDDIEDCSSDKGIFYHDPNSVLKVRSCAEEQSAATLLEELMVEFTNQLQCVTDGPHSFEKFIYTYWRRRMSELYAPNLNVVESLRQHEAFRGIGTSSIARAGVLPETLKSLLGEDFFITDLGGQVHLEEDTCELGVHEGLYCQWCDLNEELDSDDGSELDRDEGAYGDDESDTTDGQD